jgi:eukaryotic-like serine/threonine-protein kinase
LGITVRKVSQAIGKYVIERQLGSGAMGTVYLGYDAKLDRRAAIKVMRTGLDDDALRNRFFLEARSAAKLDHPNIIRIWDLDTDAENRPYIAMEYIEGEDLKTFIEEKRFLPFHHKLKIVIDVCRGLHHAHENGIIHRDIKPGNIRINRNGEAKILDFGLARLESGDSTSKSGAIGTPYYMSPEQWRGTPDLDQRSDLFSVGSVLYELISYVRPFEADDISAVMTRIVYEPHTPLKQMLPECGPELNQILDRALAKSRNERFSTCLEFAGTLQKFQTSLDARSEELRRKMDAVQAELDRCKRKSVELQIVEFLGTPLFEENVQNEQPSVMHEVPEGQVSDFGVLLHQHASLQRQLDSVTEKLRSTLPLLRLLRTSHRQLKEGQLEACEENLSKILRLSPANASALRLLDVCRKALDQRRDQEAHDARVQSVLSQARQAIDSGEFPRALQIIGRILEIDPSHPEALALCDTIRQQQALEMASKKRRIRDL